MQSREHFKEFHYKFFDVTHRPQKQASAAPFCIAPPLAPHERKPTEPPIIATRTVKEGKYRRVIPEYADEEIWRHPICPRHSHEGAECLQTRNYPNRGRRYWKCHAGCFIAWPFRMRATNRCFAHSKAILVNQKRTHETWAMADYYTTLNPSPGGDNF